MNQTDVLIVGAGPSGLILALSLAKAGIKPRIIEKNSGPGQQSRAMGVHARTLEFYRQLGFADEVVEHGIKIDTMRMWLHGEHVADASLKDFGANLSPYPFMLSYPQDEHESLLVEQLKDAGIEVEWNTELLSFQQIADEVEVKIRQVGSMSGEEFNVTYLCGCDGARSAVREGLNVDFAGGTYNKSFFVADVEATGDTAVPSSINFCIRDKDFLLVLPIRTTGSHRLIGVVPENLDAKTDLNFEDVRPFVLESSRLSVTNVHWFSIYRVHHRVAEHFRVGHVFLSGDSGHIHSPVGAQGMNTGIGDAVNLAWKLAAVLQGRANSIILDTYEPERISFAHGLLSTTDKVFQLMTGPKLTDQIFRETIFPHLFPFALGFSNIRSAAFKMVSQIRINYHHSELSHGQAGNVQGGDRLPWVPIDETSDNFTPLTSLNWQIHVYGNVEDGLRAAAEHASLSLYQFDWTDPAHESGLLRDAMYLIRPDGYVALADSSQNVDHLHDYLSKFNIVSGSTEVAQPNEPPRTTGSGNMLPQEVPVENPPVQPGGSPYPVNERDLISNPTYDELSSDREPAGQF